MSTNLLHYFIFALLSVVVLAENNNSVVEIEENNQCFVNSYLDFVTKWFEEFNDEHVAASGLGRFINYEYLKPKLKSMARGNKISMAMLPMLFHMGATTTWMVLTAMMTFKSVMIGSLLLLFKVAVVAAKVAAFFTSKHKNETFGVMPGQWKEPSHQQAMGSYGVDWQGGGYQRRWTQAQGHVKV